MAKKVIAKERLLAYPDFNKPFQIHAVASHYQLGAVVSQEGKPIAFCSRKLNPVQTRYTATERELLSIAETLKECRNMLLGQTIEVFTDHKNPVCKHFNTKRVMGWRLLLEEFGPQLTHIKGENNIAADALSRSDISEEDFSQDAFNGELAADDDKFPNEFPLSCKEIAYRQGKDKDLQKKLKNDPELCQKAPCKFSDKTYEIIAKGGKIYPPTASQHKCAKWCHDCLMHPGETRLEFTIAQHCTWVGLHPTVQRVIKACPNCELCKKNSKKHGLLPPKPTPEIIPWHTLCMDLIGPHDFGVKNEKEPKKDTFVQLHCLTMTDPATGFFECCEIMRKRADYIANHSEMSWLTRHPWPTEIVMDEGREFAPEVADLLKSECGTHCKTVTSGNPQASSMIERCHQTLANMIRTRQTKDKNDLDPEFGWSGMLAACRKAMNSTVHASTTSRATKSQLVFGRDALLNVPFEADWQHIEEQKQKLVTQNNKRENATRTPHQHNVGDIVTVNTNKQRKHGHDPNLGPCRITQAFDNGAVQLVKVADDDGGAVCDT